ncbi:hypothetical protein D3C72_1761890 [compost metagenome]
MRFGIIAINNVISIMLIGIINRRIIDSQAKTIILRMRCTVWVNAIIARGGHAFRGNHSIDCAIRNAQRIRTAINSIVKIVAGNNAIHRGIIDNGIDITVMCSIRAIPVSVPIIPGGSHGIVIPESIVSAVRDIFSISLRSDSQCAG